MDWIPECSTRPGGGEGCFWEGGWTRKVIEFDVSGLFKDQLLLPSPSSAAACSHRPIARAAPRRRLSLRFSPRTINHGHAGGAPDQEKLGDVIDIFCRQAIS